MKNIKFAVTAITLSTPSFDVSAAEPVSSTQARNMNKTGVVSASDATTLDGLEAKLAEEANAAGAIGYSVTSAIGKDKMNDAAVIYK